MAGRAPVTLLFCDLVGSTALLTRLGDAANDDLRHDVFTALRRPVEVHGGDEVKSQGDGLMVAFRGDVSDSIRCAVAMQQAIAGLDRHLPDLGLALRVGIATGEATAEDGDWFGTPVVEAARLCAAAAPGQVLLAGGAGSGADDGRGTGHDEGVAFEAVGPLTLKGFPEPRPAWAVTWREPADAAPLPPGLDPAGEVPFQARTEELQAIASALDAAIEGTPQLVVVTGEPGAGKTRLAAEAARAATNLGASVAYGRTDDDRARPLAAVVEALRWHAAAPAEPREGARDGDPAAIVHRVRDATAAAPLMLVLDDMHAAAPPLLAFLAAAMEEPAPCRLLVLALFRDHGAADDTRAALLAKLAGAPGIIELRLGPLPRTAVRDVLGTASAAVVDAVLADTGGNPARVVDARRRLVADHALDDPDAARRVLARTAPYKGLAPFDADDQPVFFGRDALADSLVERLTHSRFLAVVAPSGAGKSSLVRAGVLPRLGPATILTPGAHPQAAFTDALRTGQPVLFVDQLEECFTLCESDDERNAFLDELLAAPTGPNPLTVVVALRADFFAAATAHAGLAAALETHSAVLPPMSNDELRAAIEGPAAAAGLRLEPGLADLVVADVVGEPGGLPLLSHALLETWRRHRGRVLTIADYREAGGTRGAIARTADRVFTELLSADEQAVARSVFMRLTELGEGSEDTRRRVSRDELTTLGGSGALDRVVGALVDARLLVAEDGVVQVAHEALIREWPRLRSWLDEDREALRAHRRLSRVADDWHALGRPDADLYRGVRLDGALEALRGRDDELNQRERDFLDASEAERSRVRDELASRARAQARANRRLRLLLAGAAIGLVAAIVASLLAVGQRNRANDQAAVASDRARIATARGLVARVATLLDNAPDAALVVAVEAHRLDDSVETRNALATALLRRPQLLAYLRPPSGAYSAVAALPDGTVFASTGKGSLDRWTTSPPVRSTVAGVHDVVDLAASDDGLAVAAASADGTVTVLDPKGEVTMPAVRPPSGKAMSVAISPDGTNVAVGTDDGHAVVYDVAAGDPTFAPVGVGTGYVDLAFGPAPGQLTATDPLSQVSILDARTGALVRQLPDTVGSSSIAVADPGGRPLLAIGTGGGQSALYDATTGDLLQAPIGTPVHATGAIVGEVGDAISIGGAGGTPPVTAPPTKALDAPVVAFVDEGGRVLAAGPQGTVIASTFDATPGTIDAGVGRVSAVSVSGDGETLLVAGDAIAVWALGGRESLAARVYGPEPFAVQGFPPPGQVLTGQLSPDGTKLVMTSSLTPSRVIDPATGEPMGPLIEAYGRFADDDTLVIGGSAPFSLQRVHAPDGAPEGPVLDLGSFATVAYAANPASDRLALSNGSEVRVAHTGEGGSIVLESLVASDTTAKITGVAYSADGTRLAVAGANGLDVYDSSTGAALGSVDLGDDVATAAAFSPDGKLLAAGTKRGPIRLFDAATLKAAGEALVGHTDEIIEVAFSPSGTQLASMGADSTVRIWDVAGRQLLGAPLPTIPKGSVSAVRGGTISFSVDGKLLFAPTDFGLAAWRVDPAEWDGVACTIAGRSLTRDEWAAYLPPGTPYRETCSAS